MRLPKIIHMSRKRRDRDQRGLVIVESAIVLAALLLMLMAMIESGNIFMTWLTTQRAAEYGARFASTGQGEIEGTRDTDIIRVTREAMKALPDYLAKTTVEVRNWPSRSPLGESDEGGGTPCNLVEVEARYAYEFITPVAGLAAIFDGVIPTTLSIKAMDRQVNEPWLPCDDT